MDELKAFALVAAVAVRLWMPARRYPLAARGAVRAWSRSRARISLTTSSAVPNTPPRPARRSATGTGDYGEGFAADGARRRADRRSRWSRRSGKFLVHYPSYIWLVALANGSTCFCTSTSAMNAAYAARALLGIMLALGRKRMKAIIVAAGRGRRLGSRDRRRSPSAW